MPHRTEIEKIPGVGIRISTNSTETKSDLFRIEAFGQPVDRLRDILIREKFHLEVGKKMDEVMKIMGLAIIATSLKPDFLPSQLPLIPDDPAARLFLGLFVGVMGERFRRDEVERSRVQSRIFAFEREFLDQKPITFSPREYLSSVKSACIDSLRKGQWIVPGMGLSLTIAAGALIYRLSGGEGSPLLAIATVVPIGVASIRDIIVNKSSPNDLG